MCRVPKVTLEGSRWQPHTPSHSVWHGSNGTTKDGCISDPRSLRCFHFAPIMIRSTVNLASVTASLSLHRGSTSIAYWRVSCAATFVRIS